MGMLWQQESADQPSWRSLPTGSFGEPRNDEARLPFHLRQFGQGNDTIVALIARRGQSIFVNGEPLIGQLRILRHQDEILDGLTRCYYSAESRPCASVFRLVEGDRRPKCGICRGTIEDGQVVVACPRCGRVFHQIPADENSSAKECWTYREKCLCEHPTALGEDATWRPEQEECCA